MNAKKTNLPGVLLTLAAYALLTCSPATNPASVLRLTGVVAGEKDGLPIAGVAVGLLGGDSAMATGPDGRFLLRGLKAQEMVLAFSKEHFQSAVVPVNLSGDEGLNAIDTVFLGRDYGIMTGQVLRALDSVTPLAGALVKAVDFCPQCGKDSAITDTDGFFIIPFCAPDVESGRTFIVRAAGFAQVYFTRKIDAEDSVHIIKYLQMSN